MLPHGGLAAPPMASPYSRLGEGTKAAPVRSSISFRKAQSSMEYLLVMAFVFALLVGIIVLAYSQAATFTTDVTASQIQKVGNEIVDAVNTAYYAGPPTKKTFRLYFPQGVREVVLSNNTIVFTVQGQNGPYEYVVQAATNMTGSLRPFPGIHTITVEAQENAVNITG